jgi:hypothetical protein
MTTYVTSVRVITGVNDHNCKSENVKDSEFQKPKRKNVHYLWKELKAKILGILGKQEIEKIHCVQYNSHIRLFNLGGHMYDRFCSEVT